MKGNKKRIIQAILFLFFVCLLSSSKSVFAAQTKSYDISKNNITINKSGDYIITGKTNNNTITINKGVSTNITLLDVELNATGYQNIPILIESGGAANFILKGENKITSQSDGIHVKSGGKFLISSYSTGSLEIVGGMESSGIGGSGTIIIKGGTVKAVGGLRGYGIGNGYAYHLDYDNKENAGTIIISGGNVTAIGGTEASGGIGYSSSTSIGNIDITGGTVTAISGGAGIGDHSFQAKGNKITISGGNVTAIGGAYGAGIGGNLSNNETSVTITGGTVKASGGTSTSMYDNWSYSNLDLKGQKQENDIAAKNITITGGQIFAESCSVQPKNSKGQILYHILVQSEVGKVTKITAYQKSYGSKDINSKGILSLWLPNLNSDGMAALEVTFASGKHTIMDYLSSYNILQGDNSSKDMVFNLSVSNLEVYENGLIYKNKIYYRNSNYEPIKVTGSTSKNQIIVHDGKHRFEFENVSVDYTKQTDKMFFIVNGESDVIINIKNKNTVKTGGSNVGFYVGTNAKLSFAGTSNENKLTLETYDDSYGMMTASGLIRQFGGTISITATQNSIGVYLGNSGTFSLYNGIINGISSTKNVLYGLNYMNVNVFGGIMNMDNIGYHDEGNEEVLDKSCFRISNGEVNISNRMIFSTFLVNGGTINAHLLGCGRGSKVFMYQGNIIMDKFITYLEAEYDEETNEYIVFEYITPDGVTKKSALDNSTVYGGDIKETHNVTIEELKKISFGSC